MFAIQARPADFLAGHSRRCGPTCLRTRASRTRRQEYRAQLSPNHGAFFMRSFAQERNPTPLFSSEHAVSGSPSLLQLIYLQSFPHSLTPAEFVTPYFPIVSALFVRSCAMAQLSTPLFSSACALFWKTTREGVHPSKANPFTNNEFRGCYSRTEKKSEGLSEQP